MGDRCATCVLVNSSTKKSANKLRRVSAAGNASEACRWSCPTAGFRSRQPV